MQNQIRQKSQEILEEVISIRRHIHQHPELSFKEYETSAFVQSKLSEWNIDFKSGIVETGIVAYIPAAKETDKVIGLRADLDALPITEQNDVPYKSQNEGAMHACGHDVHTAMLLGAAKVIKELQADLKTNIKLIFQPGEEKLPGGAKLMIEEGVLTDPAIEKMYALHVFPELDAGQIGLKSGMYMASTDEIYITVKGVGGHAAIPANYVNPLVGASMLILRLQELIKERQPEDVPCVLAFGRIEGLGATNVIPAEVKIQGTFRTMDEKWRQEAHRIIRENAPEIVKEIGAKAEVDLQVGYPFLKNDPELTEKARTLLKKQLGDDNVHDLQPRMTGEDFAYFSQEVPATFIRIGVRNTEKGIIYPIHHPQFDIDENALATGVETLLTLSLLYN